MAVGEFEFDGNDVCGKSENNEGLNEANNNLFEEDQEVISINADHDLASRINDSSSSFSTEDSMEDLIEYVSIAEAVKEEQNCERNENYNPNRIPEVVFATNKNGNPMDWSDASSDSLFSIHPVMTGFRVEQRLTSTPENDKLEEISNSNPPPNSVESSREETENTKEVSQEKTNQCSGIKKQVTANKNCLSSSCRSNGSSSSSFAFPILVPGLQLGGSKKGNGLKKGASSRDTENSISTPIPPPPSSRKKKLCCSSFFSCRSLFSCPSGLG